MALRMYQLANAIAEALLSDTDLDAVSTTELGSPLHYYVQEDYERLGELVFPYAHVFCHRKLEGTREVGYGVAIAVSAYRNPSTKNVRITKEATSDNIGTVVDKIIEVVQDEMMQFGFAGEKGFKMDGVSELLIAPSGETDMQYILDFELRQENCLKI